MKKFLTLFSSTAVTLFGLGSASAAVISGTVSDFTGPDDLLLDPTSNLVAVDVFGNNGSQVVNGVTFQSDLGGPVSGGGATVTIGATNSIDGWSGVPNYVGGDAASTDNLERIMHDIRWSLNPANITVDVSGLTSGTLYDVQLLFTENGSGADRHWDIGVVGVLVVDDFTSAGTSPTTARSYSGVFDPGADGTLNILLGVDPLPGDPNNTAAMGADNNPVLSGVIIHQVPEPGSAALFGLSLFAFLARRRR